MTQSFETSLVWEEDEKGHWVCTWGRLSAVLGKDGTTFTVQGMPTRFDAKMAAESILNAQFSADSQAEAGEDETAVHASLELYRRTGVLRGMTDAGFERYISILREMRDA